jgi:hypothetical protein
MKSHDITSGIPLAMSYEIIPIIILLVSLFAVLTIIFRKIPILVQLPEISEGRVKDGFWSKVKNKIKNFHPLRSFSSDVFLQKILSKIRVLTLKTDSKTSHLLQKLREKAQQKNLGDENYWQELKDSAKKRKKS